MSLQIIKNINVDFYDKEYIMINAKQHDDVSRFISITCYNQGNLCNLKSSEHSAYVRYKKADGHTVLNYCEINYRGEVLVELTEQMLAVEGICYVDLLIVDKGSVDIDVDNNGSVSIIDGTSILSTMTFCINVYETAVDNSEFESTDEFDGLNDLLKRAEANYTEVIRLAKSYAEGNAGGVRENENVENAKYYYEQSKKNAANAKASEESAIASAKEAKTSETSAKTSEEKALEYANKIEVYAIEASNSASSAKDSAENAFDSEQNSKDSETNAAASAESASKSADEAKKSAESIGNAEANTLNSANMAKSYTVGGTGTRDGEDTDNASWYYNEMKDMFVGLNIVFIPKGTVSFVELAAVKETALAGYVYNIKDDFVTDETFREGAGKAYTAGTNVYYTVDNYWDCFGGSASPVATVEEVKSYLGI